MQALINRLADWWSRRTLRSAIRRADARLRAQRGLR